MFEQAGNQVIGRNHQDLLICRASRHRPSGHPSPCESHISMRFLERPGIVLAESRRPTNPQASLGPMNLAFQFERFRRNRRNAQKP